ncbi:hypothetical protein O0A20_12610, partial [Staphylococcus pseudintermedius]|nr:hypothetical protein [Staphylococcus pseudintermedius]
PITLESTFEVLKLLELTLTYCHSVFNVHVISFFNSTRINYTQVIQQSQQLFLINFSSSLWQLIVPLNKI